MTDRLSRTAALLAARFQLEYETAKIWASDLLAAGYHPEEVNAAARIVNTQPRTAWHGRIKLGEITAAIKEMRRKRRSARDEQKFLGPTHQNDHLGRLRAAVVAGANLGSEATEAQIRSEMGRLLKLPQSVLAERFRRAVHLAGEPEQADRAAAELDPTGCAD